MKAQTIEIDSTFISDGEIFPFSPNDTIYGLSISGSVVLDSNTSLVRIILTDNAGNEWMVYEAYPMINPNWEIEITNFADETMYRYINDPFSLKIQIIGASLHFESITLQGEFIEYLELLQENNKELIESRKVDSINQQIELYQMLWFANQTPVSDLQYSDKRARFGEKYNLSGLEYYTGGIFDARPGVTGQEIESELIDAFDWRNRHGANDPNKTEYYDGDPTGSGWMTEIENQSEIPECENLCYIYGPIAVIEGLANIYFNYHYNYNLSEQHVLDCDSWDTFECMFGLNLPTSEFARDYGILDESCYPRDHSHGDCREDTPPQGEPHYRIQLENFVEIDETDLNLIQESIFIHGPLKVAFTYGNNGHDIALIGFGKLNEGDIFHDAYYPYRPKVVGPNSDYIGDPYWIFKNSWGDQWGDNGYFYHLFSDIDFYHALYYENPSNILNGTEYIHARDEDKDGYWNWGIPAGEDIPDNACSEIIDSDDSENRIGRYDDNYYGIPVMPKISVYMMRSAGKIYITNNSYFSFNSDDINPENKLTFYIENLGNSQLNLIPHELTKGQVEIIEIPGGSQSYEISDYPDMKICWGLENATTFKARFLGEQQGELTKIKIYLDENGEIPDFEFILVYNDCLPATEVIPITEDEIWDNFVLKNQDYLISQGVTVTVTGNIAMGESSDIFIQNGGELIIDGGRLTAACNGLWNGIDVWGDRRHPQLVGSQGTVRVKNEGMIEFARCGIENIIRMGDVSAYTGGIFDVDEGILKII